LSTIKGLVVSASEPWQPKHKKRRYIGLDTKSGSYQYQYDFVSGPFFAGDISVGDGIIYNSYNVGKVKLIDCDEELVIVRSIDIEAVFPMESVDTVQVGDHAMTTAATV
jgi:co-chaperonin GroES (HSP10)